MKETDMGSLLTLKKKNNWHLISPRFNISIDSKTQRLRRFGFRNQEGKLVESLSMAYDTKGNITHYKAYAHGEKKSFDLAYDHKGKLTFYEDYEGNRWEVRWGVDFVFERGLNYLLYAEETWRDFTQDRIRLYLKLEDHINFPMTLTPPKSFGNANLQFLMSKP